MKKFISLCLILLLVLPAQAFAHSKLTTSSPEKNAVVDLSPEQIMMEFNTDIASLSTFVLETEQGEAVAVEQINVEGAQITGVPATPLENGLYNVKWTIIGADGHTVEGTYAFTVNAPEAVQEPVTEEIEATPEPSPTAEPTPSPSPSPLIEDSTAETTEEKSSPILPIILIVLVIAVAAGIATKRKKK